jgi:hypothetical protein
MVLSPVKLAAFFIVGVDYHDQQIGQVGTYKKSVTLNKVTQV